jgi:hypothetical protein
VRELYKGLANVQTHLVQSTEVATTCICPYLFRLSYPFGVIRGSGDYLVANAAHDAMSIILPSTLIQNWRQNDNVDETARLIEQESSNLINEVISSSRDWADGKGTSVSNTFEDEVKDRVHGLIVGFTRRIMNKLDRPKKALTELTITNTRGFQEGRVDAILEYNNAYALIDWKTYNISPATTGSFEKWQLIANMLLTNYRYRGNEDDWDGCLFGAVISYGNAYSPRMPLNPTDIQKVKDDRQYAHGVLCGSSPPTKKPAFCPVCDTGGSGSDDCRFYRRDYQVRRDGRTPESYDKISRLLTRRRYVALEERGVTHRHKFAINIMIERLGEQAALEELERVGIVQSGYTLDSVDGRILVLTRPQGGTFLESRKPLRVIGKEVGIPLLACVNVAGGLKDATDDHITIELFGSIAARRAEQQLSGLPIVVIPDEINLTRRILEPMHKFHRLAADILLPEGLLDDGDTTRQ